MNKASAAGQRLLVLAAVTLNGCDRPAESPPPDEYQEAPSPTFRNAVSSTAYVGDDACTSCHAEETSLYRQHAMASSFHPWTPNARIEAPLQTPLFHEPSGFHYTLAEAGGAMYQVEFLLGPGGKRLHELRKRMDHVMGSGEVARTYFTEENGRLFQLPLTWYRDHGWDFSPGYEITNARFDRLMPDRCIACHSSYPEPMPFLEGKYAALRPGIGCERCHGPGALHVAERKNRTKLDSAFDNSIVNPARLPLERRLDVCEQCHVHTAVTLIREGQNAFSYVPSQPLRDYAAFFKVAGGIDIVSHADRLRQSACFLATRATSKPLECATCHNPHLAEPDLQAYNRSCQTCHTSGVLQPRVSSASRADHAARANCVGCHMPSVKERAVPHGTFTDHWIRVVSASPPSPTRRRHNARPIEPYYERDRTGPEAARYQAMGEVLYATQANDRRALANAVAALQRQLQRDTTLDEAQFLLGIASEQLGMTDVAIRALELSVRADSNQPERLRALAHAYERVGRAPPVLESLYRRALTLQPALAWIRAEYADFLRAQGRDEDAERAYRAALAEQPSLAVARFNLGTLLTEAGRRREAAEAFRGAVARDPLLAEALSRLLELRTRDTFVSGVQGLDPPVAGLPIRSRNPRAVQMRLLAEASPPGVQFLNLPPGGVIEILMPNGNQVRVLSADGASAVTWDLLSNAGKPIVGGLYRAHIQGRDVAGRPVPSQVLQFAVVRRRLE